MELLPFSDDDTHRSDKTKLIHSVERVEDINQILLLIERNKKKYVIKWLKMIKFFLHETVDNEVWAYKMDCERISSLEAEGRKTKEEEVYSNCVCSRGGLMTRNDVNNIRFLVRFRIMVFNLTVSES